jgi:hypothetical protein
MSQADQSQGVEVLRLEDLPGDELLTRRAVVRWSDGTEGECLRWYSDEILICEGDLIGKTREQLRGRATCAGTGTGSTLRQATSARNGR